MSSDSAIAKPMDAVAGSPDKALQVQEDAIEVASQWAQEKLDRFMTEVESNGNDHKLLKISYIIARRQSIDIFQAENSDIGPFATDLIKKLMGGKWEDALGSLAGTVLSKLLGSASGSAQTERVYEVTFDELGGLNRLDAFFFCYRFASSGWKNKSKAVIGTCIVRSAATMVDDNAYRVVLTNAVGKLTTEARDTIANSMVNAAKHQRQIMGDEGKLVDIAADLSEARATLAKAIGNGVATAEKRAPVNSVNYGTSVFQSNAHAAGAEKANDDIAKRTNTVVDAGADATKKGDANAGKA